MLVALLAHKQTARCAAASSSTTLGTAERVALNRGAGPYLVSSDGFARIEAGQGTPDFGSFPVGSTPVAMDLPGEVRVSAEQPTEARVFFVPLEER